MEKLVAALMRLYLVVVWVTMTSFAAFYSVVPFIWGIVDAGKGLMHGLAGDRGQISAPLVLE